MNLKRSRQSPHSFAAQALNVCQLLQHPALTGEPSNAAHFTPRFGGFADSEEPPSLFSRGCRIHRPPGRDEYAPDPQSVRHASALDWPTTSSPLVFFQDSSIKSSSASEIWFKDNTTGAVNIHVRQNSENLLVSPSRSDFGINQICKLPPGRHQLLLLIFRPPPVVGSLSNCAAT